MTGDDLKARLKAMRPPEKEEFKFGLGFGNTPDDDFVLLFVANPDLQAKVCYRLGIPSQGDRVAKATFEAAWYAKAAFLATVVLGLLGLLAALVK